MGSPCEEAFHCMPLCFIALNEEGYAVQINETCREHFGPLFRYATVKFSTLATDSPAHRAKLEDALNQARGVSKGVTNGLKSQQRPRISFKARNIEMLTLSEGFPVKKHFDYWCR
jgi:hypothetical protein